MGNAVRMNVSELMLNTAATAEVSTHIVEHFHPTRRCYERREL